MWRTGTWNSQYQEFFLFFLYRNRYRKNLVPVKSLQPVSEKFGTGTSTRNIWYQEKSQNWYWKKLVLQKVSELVSKIKPWFSSPKFRTRKIYDRYRYRISTGVGNFTDFGWYRNLYWKNLVSEKSLGTGISRNWHRKKVSEPVSEKFGTKKVPVLVSEMFGTRKKVLVSVTFKVLGTITLWYMQTKLTLFMWI